MPGLNPYFDRPSFEPADQVILTRAIDEACEALGVPKDARQDREIIAERIADLARLGISGADALRDRVLAETKALRSL